MDRCFLRLAIGISVFLLPFFLYGQDLNLSQEDLRLEMGSQGGFNLFIRYKADISSVLITETTKDPQYQADNYAYRAGEWNAVNGDETRLIDGFPIPKENRLYSLVSSSPKWHPALGWAYQIYIPDILFFGYESGRHGEVKVQNGTYLNIRTFYYSYADYRGPFMDNPFILHLEQAPPPAEIKGSYLAETVAAFTGLAGDNTAYSSGANDLVDQIADILKKEKGNELDVVICLDATGSMKSHIDAIRQRLIRIIGEIAAESPSFRIGMVLYKDYYEEYVNKVIPFTSDLAVFQKSLDAIRVNGGGDLPEAIHEALYVGATKFSWEAPSRIMILIGDAPPHPRPRGKITKKMVDQEIADKEIQMHAIILPQ